MTNRRRASAQGRQNGARISLTANSVDENAALATVVGTLSVINGSGSYTFSITSDPDNKFDLDGADLITDGMFDYESDVSHLVTIEADNGVDDPVSRVFSITVNDVEDITTPVLGDADTPNIPGDMRPVYDIDYVNPQPVGGGVGDMLQIQWGDSEAAAEAMTPEETEIVESFWIDGAEPFEGLGDYGETLSVTDELTWRHRIRRGSLYSNWSPFRTLLIEDGVMDAPGWTDLTNQTASTRVWSTGEAVTGLGTGAFARLKGTGPLKVGSTVYEAGEEVIVENGDTLYAGVDTSATGGATVNNVVTNRGAALETFSAQTVGSSATFTVTAAPNTQYINYGDNKADFLNVQMNAGRNLIFVAGAVLVDPPTVAIDGSSTGISLVDQVQSGGESIWLFEVTIGANDTKDIRISGAWHKSVGIVVGLLENAAAGAPTAVKLTFNWRAEPISVGTHTIPTDGIGIICAANIDSTSSVSWTDATELSDNYAAGMSMTVASLTSTANPTITGVSGTWNYQYSAALGVIYDNA